ncbi:sugar ABC transporter ATP-binding protein [Pararobbsia silviterrae]|uniref:sugar ABC transporter ATP-binding protein n=1 Tax=Pararobbsia silviterrae TaxID=1792498 RepID=UPI001F0BDF2E|nr:sugar ABC transporter ATP-binding protein [Pararobbsia silviterrae]
MSTSRQLLGLSGITKDFPGVKALRGLDFSVNAGEVHALVGENGAGKSTLMKIIGGIYQPTSGEIVIDGVPVRLKTPHTASQHGIAMVHQEPKLCEALSIAENVLLGHLPTRGAAVDWRVAQARARTLLARVGLKHDPRRPVRELSIADRQLLQIAKALALDATLIILDEPTASLTPVEVDLLFDVVEELRRDGVGFVYISHHLDEIFRIAQRVTVMKDGQKVAEHAVQATNKQTLIAQMVGRELDDRFPPKHRAASSVAIEVIDLGGRGFQAASLTVNYGEVLGIAGLVGSGRTELARAICGADRFTRGRIRVDGIETVMRSPRAAIEHGIAYIAEDRRDGAFHPLSVEENIVVAAPEAVGRNGLVHPSARHALASEYIDRLAIKTPNSKQQIRLLSGGNQQKCILARWLIKGVNVIFFDEPTRGIDVGAKSEIYRIIDQLAREGKAVVIISSELPEILGMADRVIVMCEGRISGEVAGDDATEASILSLALPHSSRANEIH